jgi:hypothetical protein
MPTEALEIPESFEGLDDFFWGRRGRGSDMARSWYREPAGFELAKVIPRIGLKSEDGVEGKNDETGGKNDETGDPWLLGCSRACDIQDLNRVLRQLFELLSAVLIASRQVNPRLVMFLGELGGFLRAARQFGCERK